MACTALVFWAGAACTPKVTPPPRAALEAQAQMDEAARRAKAGDDRGAAEAYARVQSDSPRMQARAGVRAAQARVHAGELDAAEAQAWQVIDRFPDAEGARDAVRLLARLAKQRSAWPAFRKGALERSVRHKGHAVEDALRFAAAEAAESLGDAPGARREYESMATDWTTSSLFDDALFRAARLARTAGDPAGAIADLERIVDTKRTALIVGSFDLQLLHEAALEIGKIQLEDRKDPKAALRAFERVRDELGENRQRDDAQWGIATAHERAGQRDLACVAVARLDKEFPHSRYVRRGLSREAAQRLGCGAPR